MRQLEPQPKQCHKHKSVYFCTCRFTVLSQCTCETCTSLMLKLFINLCSCGCPCLRVWWAGASFLHAMDNFCPTQTLLPTRNCQGRRVQSSWISIPCLVFLERPKLFARMDVAPNLKGCPCSHTETTSNLFPGQA